MVWEKKLDENGIDKIKNPPKKRKRKVPQHQKDDHIYTKGCSQLRNILHSTPPTYNHPPSETQLSAQAHHTSPSTSPSPLSTPPPPLPRTSLYAQVCMVISLPPYFDVV